MEDPPREPADREQQRGGGRDRHPRGARRRRDQTAPGPGWSELGPRVNPAPPGAAGRLSDPRPPRGARARRALAERGDLHLWSDFVEAFRDARERAGVSGRELDRALWQWSSEQEEQNLYSAT